MINLNGKNLDKDINKTNFNNNWYEDFNVERYLSKEEIHNYVD